MKPRLLWISAGLLAFVALIALIAGTQWFQSYLRGREFLALISDLTGSTFRSSATFEPLRWTGSSVYSEQATLQGQPGSAVQTLDARQIRAEMNWRAILEGAWRIDEINITRLQGHFTAPAPDTDSASPAKSDRPASGLMALLPKRFELGRANIADAEISFGEARITGTALAITPDGSGWQLIGSGGRLLVPHLPEFKILDFRARGQGGDMFLSESHLTLGDSGKLSASGTSADGGSLRVKWESVDPKSLMDAGWKSHLTGLLSGSAVIEASGQIEGDMLLQDGRIEDLPVLGLIADFTGNPSFRRMPVQEMRGHFSYRMGVLKVEKFTMESKGLLRMVGTATISPGGALDGRFEVGVTPQTLQWLPGSRERVFRTARDGYLWTEMVVGGTLQNPTEDLSARLTTALGQELIEKGAGALQNLPGGAAEGVKSILDILRPLTR